MLRWAGRLLAAGVVYFGWGIGFALLETAWTGRGGGHGFATALAVPLAAGAIARLLDRSRLLPVVALGLVAVDTVGASLVGAIAEPAGLDLLLRMVPLVALLGSVLLTSVVLGRWSARAAPRPAGRGPETGGDARQ